MRWPFMLRSTHEQTLKEFFDSRKSMAELRRINEQLERDLAAIASRAQWCTGEELGAIARARLARARFGRTKVGLS